MASVGYKHPYQCVYLVNIPRYHQISLKIVEGSLFIVRDKGFDCGFWICFCCDCMVVQLSLRITFIV